MNVIQNIYFISISDFETKAIKKRNCEVAGQHGECMFVWQCLKTKGKHLGMCMDGFMFGSCCVYPDDEAHSMDSDEFENLVIEYIIKLFHVVQLKQCSILALVIM